MPTSEGKRANQKNPSRRKFLSPEILEKAAVEIAELAAEAGVRVALAGGYALQLFGSDRLTADIDLISDRVIPGLKTLGTLPYGGVQTLAPNGVPVDLIIREDEYKSLYIEALERAELVEGSQVLVIPLSFLAAMKLATRRGKDEVDLWTLLQSGRLDVEATRQIIYRHMGRFARDEFDSLVLESKWRKEAEERRK